jgi:hypothetical protein
LSLALQSHKQSHTSSQLTNNLNSWLDYAPVVC